MMIQWPPRSSDLTQLNFFLWKFLKSKVCGTQSESLDDLRQRINNNCQQLNAAVSSNVRGTSQNRLYNFTEIDQLTE